jgi:hypothetical protein
MQQKKSNNKHTCQEVVESVRNRIKTFRSLPLRTRKVFLNSLWEKVFLKNHLAKRLIEIEEESIYKNYGNKKKPRRLRRLRNTRRIYALGNLPF